MGNMIEDSRLVIGGPHDGQLRQDDAPSIRLMADDGYHMYYREELFMRDFSMPDDRSIFFYHHGAITLVDAISRLFEWYATRGGV